MLTRFVRIQLIIFTAASLIAVLGMVFNYLRAPTLMGIGKIMVKVDLPASGGLYRFSDVTYRGVHVGKVTSIDATRAGAQATLSIDTSPKIPADLKADVRSMSAVGEQFIDLVPRTQSAPYLRDGSVIAMSDTTIPQPIGPVLDQVSALVNTISQTKLDQLLDATYRGFNGATYDLQSLFDSSAKLANGLNSVSDQNRALIDDGVPLADSQAQTTDALRTLARSLAGITGTLSANDEHLRTILQTGPGAIDEASKLLEQIKPTLPILLANLTTISQVGVTYRPSLEQVLVLMPPYLSSVQTVGGLPQNNPTGMAMGDFALTVSDPPACTVGFLPPSSWRSPADQTTIDTPDGLYCKLPQDSPIAVRGARNYPCMGHPGKRAPTVQICDSDKPFEPLAMHQHVFGPYPIDPNLIAQGVPPDDRVDFGDNIFGPVNGTGPAPGAAAPGAPPPAGPLPPPGAAAPAPPPGGTGGVPPGPPNSTPPTLAPSGFHPDNASSGPSVAVTKYDPRTGSFATPDGQVLRQVNLASTAGPKTWQELLPTG